RSCHQRSSHLDCRGRTHGDAWVQRQSEDPLHASGGCCRQPDLPSARSNLPVPRIGGPAAGPPIGTRVAEASCPPNKSTAGSSRSLSVALLMDARRRAEQRCSCLTVAAAWLGSTGGCTAPRRV